MQNRFVGDIGDFGKYGLLRYVSRSGLSMGVNWYLTDDGIDSAGELVDYLCDQEAAFVSCDPELYHELHRIVHIDKDRNVYRIESSGLLPPDTFFYSPLLQSDRYSRDKWFRQSLDALTGSNIIFLDPDNNILRNLENSYRNIGKRYTLPSEVESYYLRGHSLIIYNHANRETDYLERFAFLKKSQVFKDAHTSLVRYNRQQVRYYLLVLQPDHKESIENVIDDMLSGPWGQKWRWDKPHFERVEWRTD